MGMRHPGTARAAADILSHNYMTRCYHDSPLLHKPFVSERFTRFHCPAPDGIGLAYDVLTSAAPGCCARLLRRATYPRQFGGRLQRANEPCAAPTKLAGPIVVRSTPASLAGWL